MNRMKSMNRTAMLMGGLALAAAAWANDPSEKFKSMDTNGDGMVSADEHTAGVRSKFERMDADKDGNVTAAEMEAGHGAKAVAKDKPKEPMTMGDADTHHEMSSADKIARMDANGDGMMSLSEHEAGARKMFDEMDADKNGSLSLEEMRAGHAMKMKEKGKDM